MMTGKVSKNCTKAKLTPFSGPLRKEGKGQPHICPIEKYMRMRTKMKLTMSLIKSISTFSFFLTTGLLLPGILAI